MTNPLYCKLPHFYATDNYCNGLKELLYSIMMMDMFTDSTDCNFQNAKTEGKQWNNKSNPNSFLILTLFVVYLHRYTSLAASLLAPAQSQPRRPELPMMYQMQQNHLKVKREEQVTT